MLPFTEECCAAIDGAREGRQHDLSQDCGNRSSLFAATGSSDRAGAGRTTLRLSEEHAPGHVEWCPVHSRATSRPRGRRLVDSRAGSNVYRHAVRISEVSARSGVPATTLRYYESVGLIESLRTPNGYRSYQEGTFARLSLIEAGKYLDLSLREIGELVSAVEVDTCTGVREALHPILDRRLDDVDRRLRSLRVLRDRLAAATNQVAACPDSGRSCGSECMVLDERHDVRDQTQSAQAASSGPHSYLTRRKPLVGPTNDDIGSGAASGGQRS